VGALLTEVLEEEGFAFVQASDLDDGLQLARACGPDLIVLDLAPHTAGGSGLAHLGGDRATRHLPLIVVLRPGARLDRSRAGSIDAVLPGPLDLDVLLEHIWRVGNARLLGAVNGPGRGEPRPVSDGGSEAAALAPGVLRSADVAGAEPAVRAGHEP
jgi:CheY-like chemotaxis protein